MRSHLAKGRVGVRVGDVAVGVGQSQRRSLAVVVVDAVLAVAPLTDDVPEPASFGRVFGDDSPRIVELANDVVVQRIPQVIDDGHGNLPFSGGRRRVFGPA